MPVLFIVMALFLTPLLQPYLINPNIIPFYSISAAFLLLVLFQLRHRNHFSLPIPVLAMIIVLPLACLTSFDFDELNVFVLLILVALIVFIAAIQKNRIHPILSTNAYIVSAVVWSIAALIVWLGFTDGRALQIGGWALTTMMQAKPNGPFVNGNVMAVLNACAWLMITVRAMREGRWSWWLLSFVFMVMVVISLSWGVLLALLPVLIWMIANTVRRRAFAVTAMLLLIIATAWFSGHALVDYTYQKTSELSQVRASNTQEHGVDERKLIWLSSLAMWQDHPFIGVGLGHYGAHYLTYQSQVLTHLDHPLPEQIALNSAHNLLLQLMAETGLPGLLLWLLITLWMLRLSWYYRWHLYARTWPFLAGAWLLWIQGMGNITMTRPFPVLLFALFLACASSPWLRLHSNRLWHAPKLWLMVPTLVLLPYLAWATVDKTQAWLDFERLSFSATPLTQQEKVAISSSLMHEPSIAPHLVATMVGERLLQPPLQHSTLALEPYVQKALHVRQDPLLLQQQFYMHVLQGRWQQACDIAKVLQPMASQRVNQAAYEDACAQKMPTSFVFWGSVADSG
jgi:O-antigen ligase